MQILLPDIPKIEIGIFKYIVWESPFSLQWVNLDESYVLLWHVTDQELAELGVETLINTSYEQVCYKNNIVYILNVLVSMATNINEGIEM